MRAKIKTNQTKNFNANNELVLVTCAMHADKPDAYEVRSVGQISESKWITTIGVGRGEWSPSRLSTITPASD